VAEPARFASRRLAMALATEMGSVVMFMMFTVGSISAFAGVSVLPWVVVIAVAAAAARLDLRCRRIPNRLTGPLLLGGLLWGLVCGTGAIGPVSQAVSHGIGDSLLGALIASFPFVILWLALGTGAGDAKLMMAIGVWLGMTASVFLLLGTALAGGAMVIVWGLREGRLMTTFAGLPRAAVDLVYVFRGPGRMQDRRDLVMVASAVNATANEAPTSYVGTPRTKTKLPYGPAIFAGVCLAALRVYFA
jgi:Flp pilus assembly protein protease CpaA